jgi:hypothetical protein
MTDEETTQLAINTILTLSEQASTFGWERYVGGSAASLE